MLLAGISPPPVLPVTAEVTGRPTSTTSASLPQLPNIPSVALDSSPASTSIASDTPATTTKQASNPFERARLCKLPSSRIHELTRSVTYFMVGGMHPYTMIDSPHFRNLIHTMEPRYTIPSRSTFRDQIIPAWHKEIKSTIHDDLKQVDAVALTTDGWTSRATEPYNTITAHYVKDWKLTTKVLQTEKMMGSHTGENLATELDIALEKWGISDKVSAITVDNAANIGKACTLCRGCEVKVGCFAHTLHLAAGKTTDLARTFTKWIRPAVGFFHRSHVGAQVFTEMQERLDLPKHKLIMDVKTRWNSTYNMVERFLEQRLAVAAALNDPRLAAQKDARLVKADLDDCSVKQCKAFVELMRFLKDATLAMSTESSPSASLILPLQSSLLKKFTALPTDTDYIKSLKKVVHDDLARRYQDSQLRYSEVVL